MCGIIGYVGRQQAAPLLLEGLRRQSYRGYDSSGIAVLDGGKAHLIRAVGKLDQLESVVSQNPPAGSWGIGHSRWATHGGVSEENAHPHKDCKGEIFVVHNGIIENFGDLRSRLEKRGHVFASQTDTEVLPHLIEEFFEDDLERAVRRALSLVRGAYGIATVSTKDPGKIVAARFSSPLVLSVNKGGGFVASDPAALLSYSNRMVFLDDGEVAVIDSETFVVRDRQNNIRQKEVTELEWSQEQAQKHGHPHFMLKEIMEQPESLRNTLRGRLVPDEGSVRLGGLTPFKEKLREVKRIRLVACGTACHAAMLGEYLLEEYAGLPAEWDMGSEFRYRQPVLEQNTLSVFISQSGETADTLAALREVKERGGLTLGIVNIVGSSVAREVDMGVYTHAGPEIAVASTKAFTSQLAVLVQLAVFLGRQRELSVSAAQKLVQELSRVPSLVEEVLELSPQVKEVAEKYKAATNLNVIARRYNYPIALEGALKIKETAYVHAEGQGGGELKHGSLALVDPGFPTIALAPADSVYGKMVSNIQEVKARGGPVVALVTQGDEEVSKLADDVLFLPKTAEPLAPFISVVPLQLFAYWSGVLRGWEVDTPRNLAKSVTVE